jgi:hypothetical protein
MILYTCNSETACGLNARDVQKKNIKESVVNKRMRNNIISALKELHRTAI